MCGPRTHPISKTYAAKAMADMQANQQLSMKQHKEPKKMSNEFEHLGLIVGRNRSAFAIDGKRIKILAVGVEYFETQGDTEARYITFKFIQGPGTTTEGRKWCITHKAFARRAELWEEKLAPRYVTIGLLMESKQGVPCREGLAAIYAHLMGTQPPSGHTREELILKVTKYGHNKWNTRVETQALYDEYTHHFGKKMPYSFLVWISQAMGGVVLGEIDDQFNPPTGKSYSLICRQLGIKP